MECKAIRMQLNIIYQKKINLFQINLYINSDSNSDNINSDRVVLMFSLKFRISEKILINIQIIKKKRKFSYL